MAEIVITSVPFDEIRIKEVVLHADANLVTTDVVSPTEERSVVQLTRALRVGMGEFGALGPESDLHVDPELVDGGRRSNQVARDGKEGRNLHDESVRRIVVMRGLFVGDREDARCNLEICCRTGNGVLQSKQKLWWSGVA